MGRATSGLMRSVTVHSRNLQQGSVIGGVIKTLLCHRLQFMGERRSEHYKLNLGWPWANSPTADAESLITESSIFIIRISISWRLRSCFSTRSKILPPGRHHKYHQQISHGSRRQLKKNVNTSSYFMLRWYGSGQCSARQFNGTSILTFLNIPISSRQISNITSTVSSLTKTDNSLVKCQIGHTHFMAH